MGKSTEEPSVKESEDIVAPVGEENRTITTKKTRVAHGGPYPVEVESYVSDISFSHAFQDFKGFGNYDLRLRTVWFLPETPYWQSILEDRNGMALVSSERFGRLEEPFYSYNEERLKKWQEQGLRAHDSALSKLEDLYWEGKPPEIPQTFFD